MNRSDHFWKMVCLEIVDKILPSKTNKKTIGQKKITDLESNNANENLLIYFLGHKSVKSSGIKQLAIYSND